MLRQNGSVLGVSNRPTLAKASGVWNITAAQRAKGLGLWPSYDFYVENLVVYLDASSYSGSGSTWTNLGSGGATYNATLFNSPSFDSSDASGAFVLNGTNQYARLTRPVADDFTLCIWFKTSTAAGTARYWYEGRGLVDCEVANVVDDFGTSIGAGKVMFGVRTDASTIVSASTYNDGAWHYMCARRTKSTGATELFVDNSSVGSKTGLSTASLTAATNMTIGAIQIPNNYLNGRVAAVQVYSVALTNSQIDQNFTAMRSRFGV